MYCGHNLKVSHSERKTLNKVVWVKMTTLLKLGDFARHGYNNKPGNDVGHGLTKKKKKLTETGNKCLLFCCSIIVPTFLLSLLIKLLKPFVT